MPEVEQPRCFALVSSALGIAAWELGNPHARHLRPDPGAIRRIEGEQRIVAWISPRPAVRGDEAVGQLRRAEARHVHQQEGEVGGNVDVAQRRVELHAVVNVDAVRHDHVLGSQVSVALPDPPLVGPRPELVPAFP